MNVALTKTKPQSGARPSWQCVVKPDHVFRERRSGELFEAHYVRLLDAGECRALSVSWPNAEITLRPVNAMGATEDKTMLASSLCGSDAWERLPDDDAETVIWGGGTKVGPVGAR